MRARGGRGGQKGRETWGEGEKVYTNRLCAESESVCQTERKGEEETLCTYMCSEIWFSEITVNCKKH